MATDPKDQTPPQGLVDEPLTDEKDVAQTPDATEVGSQHSDTQGESRMTRAKWLACIALGFGYTTAFQQHACTATIMRHINIALGPTDQYNWMLTAYTIGSAVTLPLTGGLSDIFGRRYFFMGGCFISLIGTIVAVTAKDVNQVIAGMFFKGVGGASQQLALAGVGELVPNKHRGTAQAYLDILVTPWTILGALTGGAMVKYQPVQSFRINWYVGICLNVITIVCTFFWYFPPARPQLHGIKGQTKTQQFMQLDWLGIAMLAAGLSTSLVGLGFGGITFPWKHAGTIAPMVLGVSTLVALGIYEFKFAKNPFLAPQLFRQGRSFTMVLFITFVAGMGLYAAAAFWTQQVHTMWDEDPVRIGILTIPGGFGGALGGYLAGMLIGRHRFLKTNYMLIYGALVKVIADAALTTLTPDTLPRALGLGWFSMMGTGWLSVSLIVCIQLTCEDKNIGLATMLLGCMRSSGGAVAVTVYSTLLGNKVKKIIGPNVAKAVAGPPHFFPVARLKELIGYLEVGNKKAALALPRANPKVLDLAHHAMQWSWTEGFRNVYIAATAFAAVALIAAFFVKDMSKNMTDNVAVRLDNEKPRDKTEAVV